MSDAVAQLIAGVIIIGVAGIAAFIAYRVGHRNGMREALLMDDALRQAYQEEEAARHGYADSREAERAGLLGNHGRWRAGAMGRRGQVGNRRCIAAATDPAADSLNAT